MKTDEQSYSSIVIVIERSLLIIPTKHMKYPK
jgi:hypothetical protein